MNIEKNLLKLCVMLVLILTSCSNISDNVVISTEDDSSISILSKYNNEQNIMIEKCMNDFKKSFGDEIIDTALYDIDQDNTDELFILIPSTYLLSSELHCYKINSDNYVYCGTVLAQCKINSDITDESSTLHSYDSVDLRQYIDSENKINYLLCSSFRSIYNRNSQIRTLSIEDNILQETLMFEWGINVKQTQSGEEYNSYYYIYADNEVKMELSEKDFYEYINEMQIL